MTRARERYERFDRWAATPQAYRVVTLVAPLIGLCIGLLLRELMGR